MSELELELDLGPARAVLAARGKPFHELVRIAGLDPACDLRGANLSGMNLHRADLRGYDLSGADLRNTGFLGAVRDEGTQTTGAILDPFDADMLERVRRKPKVKIAAFLAACRKAKGRAGRLRKLGFNWRDALACHAGDFSVVHEILKLDEVRIGQHELSVYRLAEAVNPKGANALGSFANFMMTVRGEMDEAERLYRAALAADPKHAINLGNFALFMEDVRGDVDEAECLYRAALAANPKHAYILGNFANFMTNVRGNMDEAENLYWAALAADPKDANILGNFAVFMNTVRGDMDEAERLYRAALAADPKYVIPLSNFAEFMESVRGDLDEAERLYRVALAATPKHANSNGNYARLLIALGREGEAVQHIETALAQADKKDASRLECWFYRYAVVADWREKALTEVEALLRADVSSPGWDLSGVIRRAKELGHPEPERLEALAAAIARPKGAPLPDGLLRE